jgi:hypothetical protein
MPKIVRMKVHLPTSNIKRCAVMEIPKLKSTLIPEMAAPKEDDASLWEQGLDLGAQPHARFYPPASLLSTK